MAYREKVDPPRTPPVKAYLNPRIKKVMTVQVPKVTIPKAKSAVFIWPMK